MYPVQMLLLDVDDTLYPSGTGPFKLVRERIARFVMDKLDLDQEATNALRKQYVRTYGSTLGGLMHDYAQDPEEFLNYVHDVPVESMLSYDSRLVSILTGISIPIIAFTNGSKEYMRRILTSLGIIDFFQGMFTIEDMDFIPKPRPPAYYRIMEVHGCHPEAFMLVDDMQDNIETARALGMMGVLVGFNPLENGPMISDIYELPRAIEAFHNRI